MGKINLNEFRDKKRAADAIVIEIDEKHDVLGEVIQEYQVFTIDPPALWSDDLLELAKNADNLALSKALLGGEEQYAKFCAAGGSQAVIGAILSEATGFSLGKSSPSSNS